MYISRNLMEHVKRRRCLLSRDAFRRLVQARLARRRPTLRWYAPGRPVASHLYERQECLRRLSGGSTRLTLLV